MINREKEGKTSEYGYWPTASIPCSVAEYFHSLADSHEVEVRTIGTGYHNAGWSYIEVECHAASFSKAQDALDEMYGWAMQEFQLQ